MLIFQFKLLNSNIYFLQLGSKMQLSRRLKQLHISEECICLLPGADKVIGGIEAFDADDLQQPSKSNCLYLRNADGTVGEYSDIQKQTHSLRNFEPIEVMVFRNLWCTVKLSECMLFLCFSKISRCICSLLLFVLLYIHEGKH